MILYDARHALRQLRHKPGFTATVILTLALGIGAATVVYSIVDAILLRPLPFPDPSRLLSLSTLEKLSGGGLRSNDVSYPNFFDWRTQAKSFETLSSYKARGYTFSGGADSAAVRITGVMVSSDFFRTLAVKPILGRDFRREDEHAGNRVAILSYGLWQSRFGSDPNVVGKTLHLDEENYSIAGIAPRGFQFPLNEDSQVWVTLAHDAEGNNASASQRGYNQLEIVGRLRDGASLQQARSEMNVIAQGLARHYPDDNSDATAVEVKPLTEAVFGDVRRPLDTLFAAVGLLLLIACANAAGLLLTRATSRIHELAVRTALGASRARLIGQLMIEALMLSVGGGVAGTILAAAALRVLPGFLPADLVRAQTVGLSLPVLGFALGVSIATGLLFGVLPALRMSSLAPTQALQENRRSASGSRRQCAVHSLLVIGETALGVILVAAAGLLITSFERTLRVDPGFDPAHLMTFHLAVPEARYNDASRVALFNQLTSRLEVQPGVQAASGAFPTPLSGGDIRISFSIAGHPVDPAHEPSERVSLVDSHFLETMRIPVLRGRNFATMDHRADAAAVVIVNDAFAKKYFSGVDPIGQHMRSGLGPGETPPMREVVGVIGNVKRTNLTEQAQPEYYIPMEQAPVAPPTMVLRVVGDPSAYENTIKQTVAALDSALPVYRLHPYSADLARITAQQRFQTVLLTVFACLALLLAGVGLYALLNYMVVQRTVELGLRFALGARRGNVVGLILKRGLLLSAAGIIVGICASALLTRYLQNMLFNVKPLDPPAFATSALVILVAAALASAIPAYSAARIEPMEALRAPE